MLVVSAAVFPSILALIAAWPMLAQVRTAGPLSIIREPKTVLLPAGPGQKPFDVTRHTIPLDEIEDGGPARDGIPAIFHPIFARAGAVQYSLRDADRILGVYLNGEAKAYPVQILNYHELVNDSISGRPILVSWCP